MANLTVVSDHNKDIIMQAGGKMFSDIDFNKLNTSIDTLGQKSGEITQDERLAASNYIRDWEILVVGRLYDKSAKLDAFLRILSTAPDALYKDLHRWFTGDYAGTIENLLSGKNYAEKFLEQYYELQEKMTALEEHKELHAISKPLLDKDTMTKVDIDARLLQYQTAAARYTAAVKKRELVFRRLFHTFKSTLNKDKDFRSFTKELAAQSSSAEEARNIVKEKSSLARMNVLISSSDVRDALKSLHEIEAEIA